MKPFTEDRLTDLFAVHIQVDATFNCPYLDYNLK